MSKTNPYTKDSSTDVDNPDAIEEAYWDSHDMDVLWDAYVMMRDAGHSRAELRPLSAFIEQTTIYTVDVMEAAYQRMQDRE